MPGNAVHGELGAALESVNAIIRAHAGGDYSAPDYPFVRAEADTDNGRLVVVMHSMAHLAGMEYGVDEMQEALATGVDIEVTYDAFESGIWVPGGSRESRVALETRYYLDSCLPVPGPGFRAACVEYAGHLGGGDSPWLPGAHPPLHSLFFDDFESGLEATWIKDGTGWTVGRPDDDTGRAGGTTPDLVARPGMCSDECAITQRIPVYLPDHSSPELVFRVNVGASLMPGEYLRVQVYNAGVWLMLHEWTGYDANHDGWLVARSDLEFLAPGEIKLRFIAKAEGSQGSIAIDDVAIRGADTPFLAAPPTAVASLQPLGLRNDLPPSGSLTRVLTSHELGLLAGDLAEMYRMATESGILQSLLPQAIWVDMVPAGASPYRDIRFSEDFESGMDKNWTKSGDPGWHASHLSNWHDTVVPNPSRLGVTATSCEDLCTITLRVPVSLSGYTLPQLAFWVYADSLLPGEYLRAQVYHDEDASMPQTDDIPAQVPNESMWETVHEIGMNHVHAGLWHVVLWGCCTDGGELHIRFATNVSGPEGRVAIDDVVIMGIEGVPPEDYAPTSGGLTPEKMGHAELFRLARDLESLHSMAMEHDAMRSHLPQGLQETLGFGPFVYMHSKCYLTDCPVAMFVSRGWDHESYMRSERLDLTDLCREKYDSLLSGLAWIDAGAYWDEFLHLCAQWHDGDLVVEAFTRILESGLDEFCASQVAHGWRLGTSGWLYPPGWHTMSGGGVPIVWDLTSGWHYPPGWDMGNFEPGQLADACLPEGGRLGEFLNDWRRMGL